MTWPAPATLLRHAPPALRLAEIVARDNDELRCLGPATDWTWPALLEGCAQTAGLLAGMQPGGPSNRALIAEYRDLVIHTDHYSGTPRFDARFDRRLLGFWRYAVRAHGDDDRVLLNGLVTLAPVDA